MTRSFAVALLLVSTSAIASAQTPMPTPPASQTPTGAAAAPARPRGYFTISGLWNSSSSFGSRSATELGSDGQPLTLFNTKSRRGNGAGLRVEVNLPLFWRLRTEVTGSWSRTDVLIDVSEDFEGAANATLKQPLTVVATEGGVVLPFKQSTKREYFLRGGVGWIRQLTTDHVLVSDGVVGDVGIGMKYWWSSHKSLIRPMGLRVDFRAVVRTGGRLFGEGATEIGGSITAGVIFGFWGG